MGGVWIVKDGRVLTFVNDAARIDCTQVAGYPAGRWDYVSMVLNGFKPMEFNNYMIMQSDSAGRIPSDYCSTTYGEFKVLNGRFAPDQVLDVSYKDACGYCSMGTVEVSDDGCTLTGANAGFHKCPVSFPDVVMTDATQQTESKYRYSLRRPFIWEIWAY
jgi:hypothetical protein